jgi:hypothetical protein
MRVTEVRGYGKRIRYRLTVKTNICHLLKRGGSNEYQIKCR